MVRPLLEVSAHPSCIFLSPAAPAGQLFETANATFRGANRSTTLNDTLTTNGTDAFTERNVGNGSLINNTTSLEPANVTVLPGIVAEPGNSTNRTSRFVGAVRGFVANNSDEMAAILGSAANQALGALNPNTEGPPQAPTTPPVSSSTGLGSVVDPSTLLRMAARLPGVAQGNGAGGAGARHHK